MLPKPPRPSDGPSALDAYGEVLELHETTLRNRIDREFYRKELRAKAKYYGTLAGKRPEGGDARAFYEALSKFLARQLEAYGSEAPVKRRRKADAPTAPLVYPDLPEELTYRVHFLERGSLKRERSAALAKHADAVSRQTAPNGDVLLSVAVSPGRVQFFERLIESIGADGLGVPWPVKAGGFAGWIRSDGSLSGDRDFDETGSPWAKMMADINQARLYHRSLDRGQLSPDIVLPKDKPPIPESLPWDPDARFQAILDLTSEDRLEEAAEHLDAIPGAEREPIFDEVLYLRFLTGATLRGEDLRYLARWYIVGSAIRPRLEEELESFIAELDWELTDAGPLTDEFPGFEDRSWLWENEPNVSRETRQELRTGRQRGSTISRRLLSTGTRRTREGASSSGTLISDLSPCRSSTMPSRRRWLPLRMPSVARAVFRRRAAGGFRKSRSTIVSGRVARTRSTVSGQSEPYLSRGSQCEGGSWLWCPRAEGKGS